MSFHCPICDKAGLPDYTKEETVCPQCDTDLKPFSLLHSISTPNKSKKEPYIIAAVSLIAVIILALFIHTEFRKNRTTKASHNQVVALKDSLKATRNQIVSIKDSLKVQNPNPSKYVKLHYTVKKGDYLYKIAKFFYGDGRKYTKIMANNHLKQPHSLTVGQTLTIKLKR